jgi:hypothetical protein
MAQSRHLAAESQCPLLGVKQTSGGGPPMSAYDPKRTCEVGNCCCATCPKPIPPVANPAVIRTKIGVVSSLGRRQYDRAISSKEFLVWSGGSHSFLTGRFYLAAMNPKSSAMTEFSPTGSFSGLATSNFFSSILPFHTLRKKSSKNLIVSCSAGQRR